MLAGKHEEIYEIILPKVHDMLRGTDGELRPYAIYLGNWMADMSQIYDPAVAAFLLDNLAKLSVPLEPILDMLDDQVAKFEEADKRAVELLPLLGPALAALGDSQPSGPNQTFEPDALGVAPSRAPSPKEIAQTYRDFHDWVGALKAATAALKRALAGLSALPKQPRAMRETMNLLYTLVEVLGIFKFSMNPFEPDHAIRPKEFIQLFADHFGSYKPYQHLDRHLDRGRAAGRSAQEIVDNFACYIAYRATGGEPGMKDYLSDGLTTAAAILNDLATQGAEGLTNADLVKLGFGLHAVEDFFAHSNFIERLIMACSHDDDQWTEDLNELEFAKLSTSNVALDAIPCPDRSKAAVAFTAGRKMPFEPHLVTGYFTSSDVAHSLYNFVADRILKIFSDQIDDGEALSLLDLFEEVFVSGPARHIAQIEALGLGTLALMQAEDVWVTDDDVQAVLKLSFPDAPPQLVETVRKLANAAIVLTTAISVGEKAADTVKSMKAVVEAVRCIILVVRIMIGARSKVLSFVRLLKLLLGWVYDLVLKEALMQLLAWLTDSLLSSLTRKMLEDPTVGSHSSIAKDDRLGQNGLYQKVQNFAVALDTLIVSNLLVALETGQDPIRWDTTLLSLMTDPFQIYKAPSPFLIGLKVVDNREVARANVDAIVRGGYRSSGFTALTAYVRAVVALNPTITIAKGRFTFRSGPETQIIALPLANARLGKGLISLPPVDSFSDWRADLYLKGEASLDPYLKRDAPEAVSLAAAAGRGAARKALDEYQAIAWTLYPLAKDADLLWGFSGT